MNLWKKAVGIKGEFHPHLFRHAFITNKLKDIILHYKKVSPNDSFHECLLHTEQFKLQLQQWTGHTHLHSLDIYIDLVFADIKRHHKVYSVVQLSDAVKIMKQKIEQIKRQLEYKSLSITEGMYLLDETLIAFEADLDSASKTE